jgi:hypothetical protein
LHDLWSIDIYALWGGVSQNFSERIIPEDYLKDNIYISKINRLLYVLQMMVVDFCYNTTLEPEEEAGRRRITMVPHVKVTNKIRIGGYKEDPKYAKCDETLVIFNAGNSREYSTKAFVRLGMIKPKPSRLRKTDYAKMGLLKYRPQADYYFNRW